jgi:hypothetical protein
MKKKKIIIIIWVVEYKIAKRSSQSEDTNDTNLSLSISLKIQKGRKNSKKGEGDRKSFQKPIKNMAETRFYTLQLCPLTVSNPI